jgi:hypothetical protein
MKFVEWLEHYSRGHGLIEDFADDALKHYQLLLENGVDISKWDIEAWRGWFDLRDRDLNIRLREGMEKAWQKYYKELPERSVPRRVTIQIQTSPAIYTYSGPDKEGRYAGIVKDKDHKDIFTTDFIYDQPQDAANDMLELVKTIRRMPRLPVNINFRYKFTGDI